MSEKRIHIVSFDVPFPANYGGVIDVFYKIKALHEEGFEIVLHCFDYGKGKQKVLETICKEVYYYKRKMSKKQLIGGLPFIVSSRKSSKLLKNLLQDTSPILFEGLHTCFYLNHPLLKERNKLVRMHNVEHDYYEGLAEAESNVFKKLYFRVEAKKLKKFEKALTGAKRILSVSQGDHAYFNKMYGNSTLISSFPSFTKVDIDLGLGEFGLYHGNLSVAENNNAVLYLLKNVISKIQYPFIVAGSNATDELRSLIAKMSWVKLEENLSDDSIFNLIKSAQMTVLPTFQATGIKLKLLNSLFVGRHCVVNEPMVRDTGLDGLCHVCNDSEAFIAKINNLKNEPFTAEDVSKRVALLDADFSSQASLSRLMPLLP